MNNKWLGTETKEAVQSGLNFSSSMAAFNSVFPNEAP
jgi:type II secretory pathway component PulF